jgi:hypothetical protein
MKIIYKEYTLQPDVIAVERFNLSRTIKVTATKDIKGGCKKGDTYDKEETLGYGYRLEEGLKQIIAFELIKNDDTVDLKGYLLAYKKINNELLKAIEL